MPSTKNRGFQSNRLFYFDKETSNKTEPINITLGEEQKPFPRHFVFLFLIILLSGVLGYFSINNGHPWSGDFALYIRQAESLLAGSADELLAFNKYAMENYVYTEPPIGPNLYPWGFPLLLSPVYALFGHHIFPMKVYLVVFLLLSLVAWHLFRERLMETHSLLLVALKGFNPYLVNFTNIIYSHPFPFFRPAEPVVYPKGDGKKMGRWQVPHLRLDRLRDAGGVSDLIQWHRAAA